MLKRLSEAISRSNIEGNSLTSEIYCPNHSSCNFSTQQNFKSKKCEESTLLEFPLELPEPGNVVGRPGTWLASMKSLGTNV